MQPGDEKQKKAPSPALRPTRLIQASPGKNWSSKALTPAQKPPLLVATPTPEAPASAPPKQSRRRRSRWRILPILSFLLCVVGPSAAIGYFYFKVASPQYLVELQFAVRGSNTEASGLIGLSALSGATGEVADSYIVQNYIRSQQLAKDIIRDQGYDIRQAYTHDFIDPVNKIPQDYPFIDFESYWQRKTQVEYNTISGNTTVRVFAFSPEEAMQIADAIVVQSEKLVNTLSSVSRQQLIGTAAAEVERMQDRLREARLAMQQFQNEEQILNPESLAQVELDIVGALEGELAKLITRRRTLEGQISPDSPVVLQINQQIDAIRGQLEAQRERIGSGKNPTSNSGSLADVSTAFLDLSITQEFAVEAYTAALASLEAAKADARQHERYLATYIPPELPDVSRHPKPYLYTGMAILWSFFAWLVLMFLGRTIRDHAT